MTSENDKANGGPELAKKLQDSLKPELPKRFYKEAGVAERDGKFRIVLDGREVKTPKKRALELPTRGLAEAIAEEWAAQGERIDPATMPLTKIANSAIDAVAEQMAEVAADVQAYGGNDLLCYRAEGPGALVERQNAAWDPLLAWAKEALGAELITGEGIMPLTQSAQSVTALGAALKELDVFQLAALHVLTTLSGSALLALAHAKGRLSADEAWEAAHVDDHWQAEQWGWDAEAQARDRFRKREFDAASRMLALARTKLG